MAYRVDIRLSPARCW